MAKKLGDPKERLMRKKSRAKTPLPDTRVSKDLSQASKSPTGKNGQKRCIELYEKAQYQAKIKNEIIQKKSKEEENSYNKLTFKPNILSKSRSRSKSTDKLPLYDRLYQWDKVRNNKKERIKEQRMVNERENCTFHPNIEESPVCDDEAFIIKNMPHINNYLERKSRQAMKKKEEEELYKKRFGYGENYVIKKTVPKEFNLSTNKSKQKSEQDFISKNHQQYLQDFNRIRSKLKTDEFFDQKIQLTTENTLFDDREAMHGGQQFETNMDQEQLAMAVNYLHQQLHYD
jgi:hypothetical protein